jgi:hypothetical protein
LLVTNLFFSENGLISTGDQYIIAANLCEGRTHRLFLSSYFFQWPELGEGDGGGEQEDEDGVQQDGAWVFPLKTLQVPPWDIRIPSFNVEDIFSSPYYGNVFKS